MTQNVAFVRVSVFLISSQLLIQAFSKIDNDIYSHVSSPESYFFKQFEKAVELVIRIRCIVYRLCTAIIVYELLEQSTFCIIFVQVYMASIKIHPEGQCWRSGLQCLTGGVNGLARLGQEGEKQVYTCQLARLVVNITLPQALESYEVRSEGVVANSSFVLIILVLRHFMWIQPDRTGGPPGCQSGRSWR